MPLGSIIDPHSPASQPPHQKHKEMSPFLRVAKKTVCSYYSSLRRRKDRKMGNCKKEFSVMSCDIIAVQHTQLVGFIIYVKKGSSNRLGITFQSLHTRQGCVGLGLVLIWMEGKAVPPETAWKSVHSTFFNCHNHCPTFRAYATIHLVYICSLVLTSSKTSALISVFRI